MEVSVLQNVISEKLYFTAAGIRTFQIAGCCSKGLAGLYPICPPCAAQGSQVYEQLVEQAGNNSAGYP